MTHEATQPAFESEVDVNGQEPHLLHEQIAALAYSLWQERGCPEGSPEEDWFKAAEQLKVTQVSSHAW